MRRRTGALLMTAITWIGGTAEALDIVATFDTRASDTPSYDPTGAKFIALMDVAVSYWEDVIEDDWTLNIEFYYDNLSDSNGTLGLHNNLGTSGGKPTRSRIRLDTQSYGTDRPWFFDDTPEDHSEFDIEQTLYRDLSAANQSNWFNGSPPDLLEVGYRGDANASAPTQAHSSFDVLSTIIHELGHAVGLTGNVASNETADGDLDVSTNLLNGHTCAICGGVHLDASTALMAGGGAATGLRRLPTTTDVLAVASAADWEQIDLPRQDMLSSGDALNDYEWEGGSTPDAEDDVWIRHGGQATIFNSNPGTLHAKNLWIGEGSSLDINANTLAVTDTITIHRNPGAAPSQLTVDTDGLVSATHILIEDAELLLDGGTITAQTLHNTGTLAGSGSINAQLINEGILQLRLDDQITLGDHTTLSGTLELLHDTTPAYGDRFDLLLADDADLLGSFDQILNLVINPDLYLAVTYDPALQWVAATAALPGDANLDGTVDLLDLSILAVGFDAPGTWSTGDFNGDGTTDLLDLSILGNHFDQATPIPMPTSAGLLSLTLLATRRSHNA